MKPRFLYSESFVVGDATYTAEQILKFLAPQLTTDRVEKIDKVLKHRTYSFLPVLENIYDRGNASAVMRSCEAMGFQALHMIEPGERFKEANRVTKGADKWLDVIRFKSTAECVADVKARGYRILATHFDHAKPITDFDFSQPTAVVFGNEKDGVSNEMLELCDDRVVIPMLGFVQSFNISVAAALCLYHAYTDRCRRLGQNGDLSEVEQRWLKASYVLRCIDNPARLLQYHLSQQ